MVRAGGFMYVSDTLVRRLQETRPCKRVVLHICRNPGTGVWAMLKELVREQSRSEGQVAALGIVAGRDWWSSSYQKELVRDQWPYLYARDPFRSATIAYLSYILFNPI